MMAWTSWAIRVALGALYATLMLGPGSVAAEGQEPFEIVRSVEAVQDRIVIGEAGARARLAKLLAQLADNLLAADREAWRDTRNVHAAVVFTLSGGPPRVIRTVISMGLSSEPDLELMGGVLAYVEGREAEAKKKLLRIDPTALPPLAGANVALVQSALVAKADPRRAIRLLDQARVTAPGTLIEETAIRRELVLADELADIDKVKALTSDYIWRFSRSAYFVSFRQHFADSVVHLALATMPAQFGKIETLLAREANPASQLELYLRIARTGLIGGKTGVARLAASRAVRLSADGSVERARATLYEGAALALTDRVEAGMDELKSIDTTMLPAADARLREAVLVLAKSIGDDPGNPTRSASSGLGEESVGQLSESASALADLARKKLAQTAEVLGRSLP